MRFVVGDKISTCKIVAFVNAMGDPEGAKCAQRWRVVGQFRRGTQGKDARDMPWERQATTRDRAIA